MTRYLPYAVALGLVSIVMPLRAADRPHAETHTQNTKVWTNDELEKLHSLGLISIVGRTDEDELKAAPVAAPYMETEDPEWYAEQAAQLNDELERRKTQLGEYRQAIDDARSLRNSTDLINLDDGDFAISPEVGIEILKRNVSEVQTEIGDLEDLPRRHDIPPGVLRGQ
jgi:hypothetical protein